MPDPAILGQDKGARRRHHRRVARSCRCDRSLEVRRQSLSMVAKGTPGAPSASGLKKVIGKQQLSREMSQSRSAIAFSRSTIEPCGQRAAEHDVRDLVTDGEAPAFAPVLALTQMWFLPLNENDRPSNPSLQVRSHRNARLASAR